MDPLVLLLLLVNYAFIACLPAFFFKRLGGQLKLAWFVTGFHFVYMPVCLLVAYLEPRIPGMPPIPRLLAIHPGLGLSALAIALSALSIGILAAALGSHRVRLSQWHQDGDAPVEIVSWGPYAVIRHPFYSGYILAAIAAACLAPGLATALGAIGAAVVLDRTAAREERRLLASDLGGEYAAYLGRTGRFWPRLGSGLGT